MDLHGSIGPEKGNYAADVRHVALRLQKHPVYVRLADRSTLYELVLCLLDHVALEPGERRPDGMDEGMWVLVSRPCRGVGAGCGWFRLGEYLHPSYVREVMNLEGEADGEVIAEFLMRLEAVYRAEHLGGEA